MEEGESYIISVDTSQFVEEAGDVVDAIHDIDKASAQASENLDDIGGSHGMGKTAKEVDKLTDSVEDLTDKTESAQEAQESLNESMSDASGMDDLYKTIGELNKAVDGIVASLQGAATATDDFASKISQSTQNLSETKGKLEDMHMASEEYSSTLVKMLGGTEQYNNVMGMLPTSIKGVITGIEGMTTASLSFLATPLGAALAALALAVAALGAYFKGTEEGEEEFVEISGYATGVMNQLKDAVAETGRELRHMFDEPTKAAKFFGENILYALTGRFIALGKQAVLFKDMLQAVFEGDFDKEKWNGMAKRYADNVASFFTSTNKDGFTDKLINGSNQAQKEAAIEKAEFKLEQQRIKWKVEEARLDKEIADIRSKMNTSDATTRVQLEAKASELINKKYETRLKFAQADLKMQQERMKLTNNTQADYKKEAELQAELLNLETQRTREKMIFDRKAFAAQSQLDRSSTKSAKDAKKAALRAQKEQSNLYVLTTKQKEQEAREAKRLALQVEESKIAGYAEGHEKVMAQIRLQEKKETLALEEQKANAWMTKMTNAKQVFDADSSNKGKTFDFSSVGFTEEEEAQWQALFNAVLAKSEKLQNDLLESEAAAMNNYLEKYGTYEQQKLAIAEEYAKKIQKANTEGEKMTLRRERDAKIAGVEATAIEKNIDWTSVFSGFSGMMRSQLEDVLADLQEYTQTDKFRNLNATDQQAITNAMQKLATELGGNVFDISFKNIGELTNEYQQGMKVLLDLQKEERKAYEELEKAQEEYANAIDKTAAEFKLNVAKGKAQGASQAVQNAEELVANTHNKLTTSAKNAVDSINSLSQGLSQLSSGSLQEAFKGFKNLANNPTITKLIGQGLGKAVGGVQGEIIEAILGVLDILKDGLSALITNLIDSVMNAVNGILKDVLSGGIVTNTLKSVRDGLGNIADTVTFGAVGSLTSGNASKVNRITAENTQAIKYLTERIDVLKESIDSNNSSTALSNYEAALKAQQEVNTRSMETLMAQMSYSSAHHSNAYYANDREIEEIYQREVKNAIAAGKDMADSINGLQDVYAMSPEQIAAIKTYMPQLWEYLTSVGKYDKSEYWEAVADQAGKVESLTEQVKESITGITFDSLYDNFVNSLYDMDKSAKDFSEDFSEYMFKAIVNDKVAKQMEGQLNKLYDKYYEKMASGAMSNQDAKDFNTEYNKLIEEGLALRDNVAKMTGYTGKDAYSQDSTKGGFAAVSQDSVDELNGRFTAVQMNTAGISDSMAVIEEQAKVQVSHLEAIRSNTEMSMNISQQAVGHLAAIEKHTSELYMINERLEAIERNTREL